MFTIIILSLIYINVIVCAGMWDIMSIRGVKYNFMFNSGIKWIAWKGYSLIVSVMWWSSSCFYIVLYVHCTSGVSISDELYYPYNILCILSFYDIVLKFILQNLYVGFTYIVFFFLLILLSFWILFTYYVTIWYDLQGERYCCPYHNQWIKVYFAWYLLHRVK